jgi:hypothetical protein
VTRGDTHGTGEPVDLSAGEGSGPLWGMASDDLNGVRYLSVHRRRGPLQIAPLPGGG